MAYFIVFPVSSSIDKKIYIFRKNMGLDEIDGKKRLNDESFTN